MSLSPVAEHFGALVSVHLTKFEESWTEGIRLEFEHGFVRVAVNVDDDTIDLEIGPNKYLPVAGADASGHWLSILGSHVRWVWQLTNHRGYQDGIQFEFTKNSRSRNIQLVAEASQLWVYELSDFDEA